jgi:hypothetical protein
MNNDIFQLNFFEPVVELQTLQWRKILANQYFQY